MGKILAHHPLYPKIWKIYSLYLSRIYVLVISHKAVVRKLKFQAGFTRCGASWHFPTFMEKIGHFA